MDASWVDLPDVNRITIPLGTSPDFSLGLVEPGIAKGLLVHPAVFLQEGASSLAFLFMVYRFFADRVCLAWGTHLC